MSNHISQEDWILFCNGEMTLPEKMPILRHCAECPECRALMDAANDLRFAAARSESTSEIGNFMDEQAYRAVAGKNGPQAVSGTKGYLSFRLESTENGYCFADEDPAADGFGNRYAMNRSTDGRQFLEDAGALSLQITGSRLLLQFNDPEAAATAQLLLDGSEPPAVTLGSETSLDLPPDGFCELEIIFEEA